MKILVPIDFSAASDWGFYYAYQLAQQTQGVIVAAHLYRPPYVESTMPERLIKEIIAQKEEEMLGHLKAATQAPNIGGEHGQPVQVEYVLDSSAGVDLIDVAEAKKVDLIIMGTHGADGALDKVWGTNTSKVVENASCPVIAVPAGAHFNQLKAIAYAVDFSEDDLDNIEQLLSLASLVGATVHCVHINVVTESSKQQKVDDEVEFRMKFNERYAGRPVTFSTRSSISVEDGLETFLRVNKIDVLSTQPRRRGFWERMFGGNSVTREMVLRAKLPILAFQS